MKYDRPFLFLVAWVTLLVIHASAKYFGWATQDFSVFELTMMAFVVTWINDRRNS